jgi:hypothetical protein
MTNAESIRQPASFRDPSGFVFSIGGIVYRQINNSYRQKYKKLIDSGLYDKLIEKKLIVPHVETDEIKPLTKDAFKIIKPEQLHFISYPYEWSFSQLKDVAINTLEIQQIALNYGMSLKDASAYNLQFMDGRAALIDTLSFDNYIEGKPWIAYRQFCQHFLAPLSLMKYGNIHYGQLLKTYIDGIPLNFASSQLPFRTRLNPLLLFHIHLHSKSQSAFSDKPRPKSTRKVSQFGLKGIIDSLKSGISKYKWNIPKTEWRDYYEETNYSEGAFQSKKEFIEESLDVLKPKKVFDMGANTGEFSRLASSRGIFTLAFDIDPAAVEMNYQRNSKVGETKMLPLLMDITNPSPGLGWANKERYSLSQRGGADLMFALALIHHLAISHNLPFLLVAEYFSKLCTNLIIEFVPKDDSQLQRLLSSRDDIFDTYNQECFELDFNKYFTTINSMTFDDSNRILYLMRSNKWT